MKNLNQKSTFNIIIKQIFTVNSIKTPWNKAIGALVSIAVPMLTAYFIGDISLGLVSSLGSFAYLYLAYEPYSLRSNKIFYTAIGLSITAAIGTLVAPYRLLSVITIGIIGFIATYIFGILKTKGPTAMFFIITFLLITAMPHNQELFLKRGLLVLASGILSWLVAMIGYLFKPHDPEIKAIKGAFIQLSSFVKIKDLSNIQKDKEKTINALQNAEETILNGVIYWKKNSMSNKFILLNERVNNLYLEINKIYSFENKILPEEISEIILSFSKGIESEKGVDIKVNKEFINIYKELEEINKIINNDIINLNGKEINKGFSFIQRLKFGLNKDSIVLVNSLRYGLVLSISYAIAFYSGIEKAYWIPLSTSAVMSGQTMIATFNRGIQRTLGTILGLIVAITILYFNPSILVKVIINILMTAVVELFILRNYGIALIFITTNGLMLASLASEVNNIYIFGGVRFINVFIGSLIGLIGTYLINKKSASKRLSKFIKEVNLNQKEILENISIRSQEENKDLLNHKDILFNNLRLVYFTALGEINKDMDKIEDLWSLFAKIENLNYLIDSILDKSKDNIIPNEVLDKLKEINEENIIEAENNTYLKNSV